MAKKKSIYIDASHKGELHRDLGIPADQPISDEELAEALKSKDPAIRARARFAKNAKTFNHGGDAK